MSSTKSYPLYDGFFTAWLAIDDLVHQVCCPLLGVYSTNKFNLTRFA